MWHVPWCPTKKHCITTLPIPKSSGILLNVLEELGTRREISENFGMASKLI